MATAGTTAGAAARPAAGTGTGAGAAVFGCRKAGAQRERECGEDDCQCAGFEVSHEKLLGEGCLKMWEFVPRIQYWWEIIPRQ